MHVCTEKLCVFICLNYISTVNRVVQTKKKHDMNADLQIMCLSVHMRLCYCVCVQLSHVFFFCVCVYVCVCGCVCTGVCDCDTATAADGVCGWHVDQTPLHWVALGWTQRISLSHTHTHTHLLLSSGLGVGSRVKELSDSFWINMTIHNEHSATQGLHGCSK